jgi:catechol 2,3-dioxygenase-like lactoylglutathione lyase family enzyme
MEQRISLITLGVADLDQSRKFYERLGWRRSMANSEGIVFFQAGGMALALYPRTQLAKDANIAPGGQCFGGITLADNARSRDEVDMVLGEAQSAGARLLKPAEEAFGVATPDTSLTQTAFRERSRGIHLSRSQKMQYSVAELTACTRPEARTTTFFSSHRRIEAPDGPRSPGMPGKILHFLSKRYR